MANALLNGVELAIVVVIVEFFGFFLEESDARCRHFVSLDPLGS